jgi:hypothetical protein
MPVVNALSSATVALPAGSWVKFDHGGEGLASVGPNAPQLFAIRGGEQIGPFDVARSVTISAARALTYNVKTNPVQVFTEAGGLVGADGSAISAGAQLEPETLVQAQTVSAGSFNSTAYGVRSLAPPHSHYPKRKTLALFTPGSTLFTSGGGAAATVATDWNDPWMGQPFILNNGANGGVSTAGSSPRITIPVGSTALLMPSAANTNAFDVSNCNVYLAFRSTKSGTVLDGNWRVRLYSTATPSLAGADYHQGSGFIGLRQIANEWQVLSLPIESFTAVGAGATLTGITHAAFQQDGAGTAEVVTIGGIWACPRTLNKGYVVIGFDDCRLDTWSEAARRMASYGFPGVVYPGAVGAVLRSAVAVDQFQMHVQQLRMLQEQHGWQIASQAFETEAPVAWTPDDFAQDAAKAQQLYAALGMTGGMDGSYYSSISAAVHDRFRRSYRTMRSYTIPSAAEIPSFMVETVPIGDPMNVRALGVDTGIHTATHLQNHAAKCAARRGLGIFVFHGVTAGNSSFNGLLDYLDANRATIEVGTMDRLLQYGYATPI